MSRRVFPTRRRRFSVRMRGCACRAARRRWRRWPMTRAITWFTFSPVAEETVLTRPAATGAVVEGNRGRPAPYGPRRCRGCAMSLADSRLPARTACRPRPTTGCRRPCEAHVTMQRRNAVLEVRRQPRGEVLAPQVGQVTCGLQVDGGRRHEHTPSAPDRRRVPSWPVRTPACWPGPCRQPRSHPGG